MREEQILVAGCRTDVYGAALVGRVLEELREAHPRIRFGRPSGRRQGDTARERSAGIGGRMQMLACGEIDILVIDSCDVPLNLDPLLAVATVLRRGNPFDVFVSGAGGLLDDQPPRARVAAAGRLRTRQLLYHRPDIRLIEDVSGVDSLDGLIEAGQIEGYVLPATEMEELGRQDSVVEVFTSSLCMPPAGQGGVALVVRRHDRVNHAAVAAAGHRPSFLEFELERAFLAEVGESGGLVGVLGSVEKDEFAIEAAIVAHDGSEKVIGSMNGRRGLETKICRQLAEELLADGGKQLLSRSLKAHQKQER